MPGYSEKPKANREWTMKTLRIRLDHLRPCRLYEVISLKIRQCRTHREDEREALLPQGGSVVGALARYEEDLKMRRLNSQVKSFVDSYRRTKNIEDMNKAIAIMEQAINMFGESIKPGARSNLARLLLRRFDQTGMVKDLDRGIELATTAVEATPKEDPEYIPHLSRLGGLYRRRVKITQSSEDLDRAIDIASQVANAIPEGHRQYVGIHHCLGNDLFSRYQASDTMDDLNRAIDTTTKGMNGTQMGSRLWWKSFNLLSTMLVERFSQTLATEDLDRMVQIGNEARSNLPPPAPRPPRFRPSTLRRPTQNLDTICE